MRRDILTALTLTPPSITWRTRVTSPLDAITAILCTDFWDRHKANIATRQKGMLGEGLFGRPKKRFWREIIAFSPQLYRKIMLIRGKCNFLLELPQNMLERNTENYSPCVRSIVKSSSRNSLEILQLHIRKGSVFSQLSTLIRSR